MEKMSCCAGAILDGNRKLYPTGNAASAGYQLQKGAALFFPGTQSELIRLALAASSATQV